MENLPPIDDPLADTVFIPLNMAPLDGSGIVPAPAAAGDPGGTPMQGPGALLADPAATLGGTPR